jgi:type I restriction enzyme M protein
MFYNTGIGTFVWIVTNRKAGERKGKIQLLDARDRWKPMRRSLGDKRRYLTDEDIDAISHEHGDFNATETSKLFDNADFGYRRITVERPLRLRFQITDMGRATFLDKCPELFDAVDAMVGELGDSAYDDWNDVWTRVQRIFKEADASWTAPAKKLFRLCFTTVDPEAKPVVLKRGQLSPPLAAAMFPNQDVSRLATEELNAICGLYADPKVKKGAFVEYEPDPSLRDTENITLKESVVCFFQREVLPYVPDAWIDRATIDEKDKGIGKVAYEINFNRAFFKYTAPRPLDQIDKELRAVEARIVKLLTEVTA